MAETRPGEYRAILLFTVATLCLVALVGRLCYIQAYAVHAPVTKDGKTLGEFVAQQQSSTIPIPARRGEILDAVGRVLATTQERPSVYVDLNLLTDTAYVAGTLERILHAPRNEYRKLMEQAVATGRSFLWIKRLADTEEGRALEDARAKETERSKGKRSHPPQDRLACVGILNEPLRSYPMHSMAAHVVGFVNIDGVGQEGVERTYDDQLKGTPGSVTLCRDARRRPIGSASGSDAYVPPRDGMTLRLTIDVMIQEALERYVGAAVKHFKAESGVGLVMDPRTGAVLGMASHPTYDPNEPGKAATDQRRNRVIVDPCEPGSTFKPFVAAAALAENVVKKGEVIHCENGSYAVGSRVLHDHHPYGPLTFEQIVIKSSNVGMAKLGQRLGNDRLHRYLSAPNGFGFGTRTGIDLPAEDPGMLLPLRTWTTFSTTSLPMGQEVSLTPLQLATAFCAIVNGGTPVKPHVAGAILDPRGNVVKDCTPPKSPRRIIPKEIAEYMTKTVLVGVVNEGTGTRSQLERHQVLGKTGTAQIAAPGGRGYAPDAYTSSFVAAAPASDPAVVVLIMIRKPDRRIAYYGGTVAAPAVREVMRHTLAYLEVPPDKEPPADGAARPAAAAAVHD